MNSADYLNQISASNRPTKSSSFFSAKILKFIIGGLILAALIIIVGSMLGKVSVKERTLLEQFSLRSTNLSQSISTYNTYIKSSKLRAMNVSLSGILTNSARNINELLVAEYEYDPKKPQLELSSDESELITSFNSTMDDAKLNGILDRTWTRETVLQIALLMSIITEAQARSKSSTTTAALDEAYSNLSQLYDDFSSYSDLSN